MKKLIIFVMSLTCVSFAQDRLNMDFGESIFPNPVKLGFSRSSTDHTKSLTDPHHLKVLLEFTLSDVNRRLENAEG